MSKTINDIQKMFTKHQSPSINMTFESFDLFEKNNKRKKKSQKSIDFENEKFISNFFIYSSVVFKFSILNTTFNQMQFRFISQTHGIKKFMLYSNQFEMFFFDDLNIFEFLEKYQDFCFDYDLEKNEMIGKISKYCDVLNEQYVKTVAVTNVNEGNRLIKILSKKYKNKNNEQQIYFIYFLKKIL